MATSILLAWLRSSKAKEQELEGVTATDTLTLTTRTMIGSEIECLGAMIGTLLAGWIILETDNSRVSKDMDEMGRWIDDCQEFMPYLAYPDEHRQHLSDCDVPVRRPYPIDCDCREWLSHGIS